VSSASSSRGFVARAVFQRAMRLVEAVANNLQGAQGDYVLQPAEANAVVGYDRQGAAQGEEDVQPAQANAAP